MKNHNLSPYDKELLNDILDTFLDRNGWDDDEEAYDLITRMRMARYITLTYHDVTLLTGNDLKPKTMDLDEFMERYDDQV